MILKANNLKYLLISLLSVISVTDLSLKIVRTELYSTKTEYL